MALDGVAISGIKHEIQSNIIGGRIYKIYQPEADEICLIVKNKINDKNETFRLTVSADASMPLIYFSEETKDNPVTAPNFCMLLRKHIGNGRIISVAQPGFERIIEITIEHLDELGDLCQKKLIVEIMGKHSNIIFTDDKNMIIDSIKHISHQVSSVREVLPGRIYEYPPNQDKFNPLTIDVNTFMNHVISKPLSVAKAIYTGITGIAPATAMELCYRACVDGNSSTAALGIKEKEDLYRAFRCLVDAIEKGNYEPCIAFLGYEPKEFSSVRLSSYGDGRIIEEADKESVGIKLYESTSKVIEEYYSKKSIINRIRQRSTDLRKIVGNAVERTSKKYSLQCSQLADTEKREKYKVYGELITAFGYGVSDGADKLVCENYYTGEEVTIPLDKDISVMENGKKYFAKYNKLKRTYEALTTLIESSKEELDYLLGIQNSLDIANSETDLNEIKAELIESGYIRGRIDNKKNKRREKSKVLHFVSSDGYDIYVGKNNYQNEELTFDMADSLDMWFHAKQMPGSHVIVKTNGDKELPDSTYEEAARLAAYFSTGKDNKKVDIDYTLRKNLKKPPKSKPGFVIYHTNYSMTIEPDIHGIREVR